jgi:hypothetical protein
MAKMLISMDEREMQKMEQLVLDRDGQGALLFLQALRKKLGLGRIGCNPIDLRIRSGVDTVIGKANDHPEA